MKSARSKASRLASFNRARRNSMLRVSSQAANSPRLSSGVPSDAKPFESLGYRQALQVVRGELSVAQAIFDTALRTRQYAKRQLTWFRHEPDIQVVEGFGDEAGVIANVMEKVREFGA